MPRLIHYPKVDGFAISDKNAPDYIKKAYKSSRDQKSRCYNPNDPRYKWWGAKGIKVEYSPYDFVLWYREQWSKRPNWNRPNVSRIDHDKNYSLDNIELLECSENSKERIQRLGPGTERISIAARNIETGECKKFSNLRKASRELKIARSYIRARMLDTGSIKPAKGWVFI